MNPEARVPERCDEVGRSEVDRITDAVVARAFGIDFFHHDTPAIDEDEPFCILDNNPSIPDLRKRFPSLKARALAVYDAILAETSAPSGSFFVGNIEYETKPDFELICCRVMGSYPTLFPTKVDVDNTAYKLCDKGVIDIRVRFTKWHMYHGEGPQAYFVVRQSSDGILAEEYLSPEGSCDGKLSPKDPLNPDSTSHHCNGNKR
jgi:hypothetical protein